MKGLMLVSLRAIVWVIVASLALLLGAGCSGGGSSYSVGYGSYYGGYYDPYPGRNYYRRDYVHHSSGHFGRPARVHGYHRGRR